MRKELKRIKALHTKLQKIQLSLIPTTNFFTAATIFSTVLYMESWATILTTTF